MKILNLYCGVGGNRKLWTNVEVTAVENDVEIANIYSQMYPQDEVIVGDAHKYLEKNFKEFDFIWSSPPCQSHSKMSLIFSKGGRIAPIMPDMSLYEEIVYLDTYFNGLWVVENVKPYYIPPIPPSIVLGRHFIWSNFDIPFKEMKDGLTHIERGTQEHGFVDLRGFKTSKRKDQMIRNCVDPLIGQYILNCAKIRA